MLGTTADPPAAYELLERHLGRSIDRDAVRVRRARRESELLARELPLPGVRALLEAAREARLLLAVASSSDRAWVRGHLERFRLLPLFHAIACADDVERTKPFPDLYLAALARLEVVAGEAVAFEDSPHGVSAAKRAGLFCVAVPNRVTRGGDFASADMVIPSLSDVALADIFRAASAD